MSLTEQEMKALDVPFLKDSEDLARYIEGLIKQDHDYGTCVYAMSMSAVAAFQHVAANLGVTGFQASCADMDVLRRTRNLKGPAQLVDLNKFLYPQYDPVKELKDFVREMAPWFREQATKNIKELKPDDIFSEKVIAHWSRVALDGVVIPERKPVAWQKRTRRMPTTADMSEWTPWEQCSELVYRNINNPQGLNDRQARALYE